MSCRLNWALGLGCCLWALESARGGQPVSAIDNALFYSRTTNQFSAADFYKPAVMTNPGPAFELAPLIIQEVTGSGLETTNGLQTPERKGQGAEGQAPLPGAEHVGAGSLPDGVQAIDQGPHAMYESSDAVQLKGKWYKRSAFLWCYVLPPRQKADASLSLEGVRITSNSQGQPAIWEVLADSSGAQLIFISRSLEAAAQAEFGNPLPGRRYAIERSIEEAPRVIVARVIDDGPVTMGPIVYLQAGTHDVSTLICRCMAAQVKTFRATCDYQLKPLSLAAAQLGLIRNTLEERLDLAYWPRDAQSTNRLENCLRLPRAL